MNFLSSIRLSLLAVTVFTLFSCSEKEEFTSETLADYLPLTAGKYITYRLDSMVFTNFGRTIQTHKFQVKHVIDAQILDNLGRPSYRIYRYIRDSVNASSWTPSQPWINAGTYFITPLADQVEVIEDNLRFIKLHMPIKDGFSWRGNRYLPFGPYQTLFNTSIDDGIMDWDFHYEGQPSSFSYRGNNYSNVYTIEEADETFNVPITFPNSIGYKLKGVEKYSRNIGLVYREYDVWEYQPNTNNPGGPYYAGFGITMWMIDHN